jgi:hypothetical protein
MAGDEEVASGGGGRHVDPREVTGAADHRSTNDAQDREGSRRLRC